MDLKQYEGYGNGYKYQYEETENSDKIIITATVELEKDSKSAMKLLTKADEKTSSALLLVLQQCYRDLRREMK